MQAAQLYFEKWELYSDVENMDEEKKALGKDFLDWMRKDESTMEYFHNADYINGDPVDYWLKQAEDFPKLSVFSDFLLCCPVQGASCERMFKDWQLYHTNKRNKLASLKGTQNNAYKEGCAVA